MFGAFMDAVMQIPKNMHAEEMQDDAQTYNHFEAQISRDFNSAQAAAARQWQQDMASTAYQRSANDMSRAGFNRILTATKGPQGAMTGAGPSGSGAAASSAAGVAGNPGTGFAVADLMEAQKKKLKEETIKETQLGYNVSMDTQKKENEHELLRQQRLTEEARTDLMRNQATSSAKDVARSKIEAEIDNTTYGTIMRYLDRLRGTSQTLRNFQQ